MPSDSLARIPSTLPPVLRVVEPSTAAPPEAKPAAAVSTQGRERERPLRWRELDDAAAGLHGQFTTAVNLAVKAAVAGGDLRELEEAVATGMATIAAQILALTLASACREAMEKDIKTRVLQPGQFRVRGDDSGYATIRTTFGLITFPTFAYRDLSGPASVTRHPARALLEYHAACRSSPLCLELEARLGMHHPFLMAQEMFRVFSRGASTIEDTTIARHVLHLGSLIDFSWLYSTPKAIRRTLRDRATRDKKTGRPLIYFSSDAHALRRYDDDGSWGKQWKMVNGLRVWCEDARTGAIIHLGGEFLWGDCQKVEARIRALLEAGILPNENRVWRALNAQVVFVSDGAEWFLDRIVPLVPGAEVILDPYHLIDWFADFGRSVYGVGTERARAFHAKVRDLLFRKKTKSARNQPPQRKGHKKSRGGRTLHAHDHPWLGRGRPRTTISDATADALLEYIDGLDLSAPEHHQARETLVTRLVKNARRIDYPPYLARGIQIGSGAMESLHRSGSQLRLKRPGATWLEETSQAVLNLRMLEMSGRWSEFWGQPDLTKEIARAFHDKRKSPTSRAA